MCFVAELIVEDLRGKEGHRGGRQNKFGLLVVVALTISFISFFIVQ